MPRSSWRLSFTIAFRRPTLPILTTRRLLKTHYLKLNSISTDVRSGSFAFGSFQQQFQQRSFGNKKKGKKKAKKGKAKEDNFHREKERKLLRMRNLHPAAKWKRVLSAANYWFSDENLKKDVFLRDALIQHRGWLPISILATFPKLQHWSNPQLLVDAFNSGAANRYRVIYNKQLCTELHPPLPKRRIDYDTRDPLDNLFDKQPHYNHLLPPGYESDDDDADVLDNDFSFHFADGDHQSVKDNSLSEDENDFNNWKGNRLPADEDEYNWESDEDDDDASSQEEVNVGEFVDVQPRSDEVLVDDAEDREDAAAATAVVPDCDVPVTGDATVELTTAFPDDSNDDATNAGDTPTGLQVQGDSMGSSGSHDEMDTPDDQEAITEENVTSLRREEEDDDDDDGYDWGDVPDEKDELLQDMKDTIASLSELTGTNDTGEQFPEESPSAKVDPFGPDFVMDDADKNIMYALVRHTRITKAKLDELEKRANGWSDDEDEGAEEKDNEEVEKKKKKKPKKNGAPEYSTDRPVLVVNRPQKLAFLCQQLDSSARNFARKSGDDPNACVIGMDVEYCTLELDIRSSLPALIQLSSPDPQGPVGLIWIDRFPDHGRTMLKEQACEPLIKLLSDPTILKVGVGVSKDVKNLSHWWGLTKDDNKHMHNFFGGIVNIDNGQDAEAKSLQELCDQVLGLHLLKEKEVNKSRNRSRKQQGKRVKTSHWRAKEMTPKMKTYAVNDVACSVDVWKKIHNLS